jgi:hypothetical protein
LVAGEILDHLGVLGGIAVLLTADDRGSTRC